MNPVINLSSNYFEKKIAVQFFNRGIMETKFQEWEKASFRCICK